MATPGQPLKRNKGASSKLRKRKLYPPEQYHDALADDVERAEKNIRKTAPNRKLKSVVALGELIHARVRPNLLGPTLILRFAETVNSSLSVFDNEAIVLGGFSSDGM